MKRIIDYTILDSDSRTSLESQVIKAIKNGWQPLGGVAYTGQPSWKYVQAVVRYE